MRSSLSACAFVAFLTHTAHAATSLESLANQVVKQLDEKSPAGVQVAIGKVTTDQPIANEAGLTTRIAEYVVARLKDAVLARDVRDSASARLARRPTIFLQPQLLQGTISVTAQVFVPNANVWLRAKEKENPLVAQTSAFAQADVELRQFLPPIALERLKLASFTFEPYPPNDAPMAIACGDLNGRGTLAVVSRNEVRIGYLAQGHVHWERKVKWVDIARRSPVPLREPIATALLNGRLWVGSSDRGGAVFDGKMWKSLHGLPTLTSADREQVWCATPKPFEHALSGVLTNCRGIEAPLVLPAHEAQLWQEGGRVLVRPLGAELVIRDASGANIELEGAEVATLGDLDQDGKPEVILSTDAPASIRVAVVDGQSVLQKLQLDAPRPVISLASCPAETEARPSVLALTANEVLRVR